jgi:hypothetical protein
MTSRRNRVLAVVLPLEIVSAVFAWRDLSGRGDGDIRGNRWFWRVLMVVNPGNSFVYWLVGRR